jgi:hypothetical protein
MVDNGSTVTFSIGSVLYSANAYYNQIPDGYVSYSENHNTIMMDEKWNFSSNILLDIPTPIVGTAQHYLMRGKDIDCGPTTYRYWVTTSPDPTGSQYVGIKCGVSALQDIIIVSIF